jgi:DNA-binding LytR/AlgR family response regulator
MLGIANFETKQTNRTLGMSNNVITCLIVDDDEMVRLDLETRLSAWPGVQVAGSVASAIEASQYLVQNTVDLILLDINLPGMSGFSFVENADLKDTQVVLMTGEKEHAANAFEFDVTDFLVKPFTDARFMKTMLRVTKKRYLHKSTAQPADHIFVKVNSVLEKIVLTDIQYIEAMADYVSIQTTTKRFTVHSTMKSIEKSLPESDFIRVHNSYIVRLDQINRVEDNSVIIGQKLIPISRARLKPLMDRLNLL